MMASVAMLFVSIVELLLCVAALSATLVLVHWQWYNVDSVVKCVTKPFAMALVGLISRSSSGDI